MGLDYTNPTPTLHHNSPQQFSVWEVWSPALRRFSAQNRLKAGLQTLTDRARPLKRELLYAIRRGFTRDDWNYWMGVVFLDRVPICLPKRQRAGAVQDAGARFSAPAMLRP
jgi:hypothetical protein